MIKMTITIPNTLIKNVYSFSQMMKEKSVHKISLKLLINTFLIVKII